MMMSRFFVLPTIELTCLLPTFFMFVFILFAADPQRQLISELKKQFYQMNSILKVRIHHWTTVRL